MRTNIYSGIFRTPCSAFSLRSHYVRNQGSHYGRDNTGSRHIAILYKGEVDNTLKKEVSSTMPRKFKEHWKYNLSLSS